MVPQGDAYVPVERTVFAKQFTGTAANIVEMINWLGKNFVALTNGYHDMRLYNTDIHLSRLSSNSNDDDDDDDDDSGLILVLINDDKKMAHVAHVTSWIVRDPVLGYKIYSDTVFTRIYGTHISTQLKDVLEAEKERLKRYCDNVEQGVVDTDELL